MTYWHIGILTGWGRNGDGGPAVERLQQVHLEIISNKVCEESYREIKLIDEKVKLIGRSVMCADSEDADACKGDSGSPLVTTEEGSQRWTDNASLNPWYDHRRTLVRLLSKHKVDI